MNRFLFLILFLCFWTTTEAQEYYLPYNINEAYFVDSTRSLTGEPGVNYFQNKASYTIKADFDPENGMLNGEETIVYYNNSPDSLYYLVIRLYHDILKEGGLRDEVLPKKHLTNGIEISYLSINNTVVNEETSFYLQKRGTNLYVGLNDYLNPGDSVLLSIKWSTQIPPGHVHRFGKYGNNNWFVAYWYPQIAVYDDIDDWDTKNYTGTYEFYNDMNDFRVDINLPTKYLAWATGDWLNSQEVLSSEVMQRYQESEKSDSVISVVSKDDWKKKKVFKHKRQNTFSYSAKNVPDFAFAVSKTYLWDAASTIVDSVANRRTTLHTVYPEESAHYKDITLAGLQAINHFSHFAIKVPYPYPNVTIFNGAGGMEFPMMVNQRYTDLTDDVFTAIHELFHGYFPFYTGINERKYAWLDEGLTSFLPIETEALISGIPVFPLNLPIEKYNNFSGNDSESSLFIPSYQTRGYNYYHQAYYRSTVAFAMLEDYLGRDVFRYGVRLFVERWKLKHPTGYDFIFTIEEVAGEDLSWLVNPWFFSDGWADLAIDSAKVINDELSVTISNIGSFPVSVALKVIPVEGDSFIVDRKSDVWKNTSVLELVIPIDTTIKRIELVFIDTPDKLESNNYYFFED